MNTFFENYQRLKDRYLKNGMSNSIAHVRKHGSFQLYRAYLAGKIDK